METVKIDVPKGLEKKVKGYLQELEKKRRILEKTAGMLKTEKSSEELKVELYG